MFRLSSSSVITFPETYRAYIVNNIQLGKSNKNREQL